MYLWQLLHSLGLLYKQALKYCWQIVKLHQILRKFTLINNISFRQNVVVVFWNEYPTTDEYDASSVSVGFYSLVDTTAVWKGSIKNSTINAYRQLAGLGNFSVRFFAQCLSVHLSFMHCKTNPFITRRAVQFVYSALACKPLG